MDEKDHKINKLIAEIARWKGRAIEATERACIECERYEKDDPLCRKCRMTRIREEAEK